MTANDIPLGVWVEGYLDYLAQVRRLKPRTIIDIRCSLRRAVAGMEKIRPGEDLWKVSLQDYLRWIEAERVEGASPFSLAKMLSHIRGLLEYAMRSGKADRNVLEGFHLQDTSRSHTSTPRVLSIEEAKCLVEACGRSNAQERRERVIVLLLYGCGLRNSELCSLNLEDIDLEREEIFIRHGKGDRQRKIPVPRGVWTELLAYRSQRGGKKGALFKTVKRKRISTREVGRIIFDAVGRAGIDGKVTPKTLRHTYATHLMDQGVDPAVISSLMGHRSPTETGVYLHVLPGRSEEAVSRLMGSENNGNGKEAN